jgi:hypothetical protein
MIKNLQTGFVSLGKEITPKNITLKFFDKNGANRYCISRFPGVAQLGFLRNFVYSNFFILRLFFFYFVYTIRK